MNRFRRLLLAALSFMFLSQTIWAAPQKPTTASSSPRRVLTVSLYPYIPNAADYYRRLETAFEDSFPVNLVITLNSDRYYDHRPGKGGLIEQKADIYEIDHVMLDDFIALRKVQPISAPPDSFRDSILPTIRGLVQRDTAQWWGWPHWMCGNFLLARPGITSQASHSLPALLEVLDPATNGLIIDFKGRSTLGEHYLDLVAANTGPAQAIATLDASRIDSTIINEMRLLLMESPKRVGRDDAYHDLPGFYARQFARGTGAAFVGYSEQLFYVSDESSNQCWKDEPCLRPDQLSIYAWPPSPDGVGVVWSDVLALDASLQGTKKSDALAFLRFMTSREAYRSALLPEWPSPPSYLLPARTDVLADPAVVKQAPLYPRLMEVVGKYRCAKRAELNKSMRMIGESIDSLLPANH